ncbi:cobalamin B12-binding domain-containing protein [Candidatus Desulfosporosinus nitrosoreducens]|uniref:cobalamin B12-binding domain-containing protein n=1 Tax=Candidatus Desulfosporosinus nitrosoreducens TaxID=3401928 RepID=UPI00280B158C|nr:cobalamin-dependent protein [Desulfosporosinus sp. PR]
MRKERLPMALQLAALVQAVTAGHNKAAVAYAETLLAEGTDVYTIVQAGLLPALQALDVKCTSDDFNLLEIMLAGRALMDVMDKVVAKHLTLSELNVKKRTIVLGTIKGDIHELGKHVVRIILRTAGYRVVDLGKDVEPVRFVQAAGEEKADYIFVSGLITVVMPYVRQIKELVEREGLSTKIVAGGAALQQATAEELAVDYVAKDAFAVLHYLQGELEEV